MVDVPLNEHSYGHQGCAAPQSQKRRSAGQRSSLPKELNLNTVPSEIAIT
jgi:hypothetical protein